MLNTVERRLSRASIITALDQHCERQMGEEFAFGGGIAPEKYEVTFAVDPSYAAQHPGADRQPLGLSLQNMREWCIVSNVKNSGLAWHRVGMGDVLMAVNGKAVPGGQSYNSCMELLVEATWPMTLTFARAPSWEGWITKRSRGKGAVKRTNWQRRYAQVHSGALMYYTAPRGEHKGTIKLDNCDLQRSRESQGSGGGGSGLQLVRAVADPAARSGVRFDTELIFSVEGGPDEFTTCAQMLGHACIVANGLLNSPHDTAPPPPPPGPGGAAGGAPPPQYHTRDATSTSDAPVRERTNTDDIMAEQMARMEAEERAVAAKAESDAQWNFFESNSLLAQQRKQEAAASQIANAVRVRNARGEAALLKGSHDAADRDSRARQAQRAEPGACYFRVLARFVGETEHELTVNAGDVVELAAGHNEEGGWLQVRTLPPSSAEVGSYYAAGGRNSNRPQTRIGFVPADFLEVCAAPPGSPGARRRPHARRGEKQKPQQRSAGVPHAPATGAAHSPSTRRRLSATGKKMLGQMSGGETGPASTLAAPEAQVESRGMTVDELRKLLANNDIDAQEFRDMRARIKAGETVTHPAFEVTLVQEAAPVPAPAPAPVTRKAAPTRSASASGDVPRYMRTTQSRGQASDEQLQHRKEVEVRSRQQKMEQNKKFGFARRGTRHARDDLAYVASRYQEDTEWQKQQDDLTHARRPAGRQN